MDLLNHLRAKDFAHWIKSKAKTINILAGLFLGLTFVSGIAWVMGAQIEPIAFVLGLCSSSLFGVPHLAEFIDPTPKLLGTMSHDELLKVVLDSDHRADWRGLCVNNWISEVYFRRDPRFRFRTKYLDDGIQNDNYQDDWANRHPDPTATGYWYDLAYDGNLIERFILVSIDGGRANVPPPDWQTRKIKQLHYKVAQIHDTMGTLDEYIRRSGLTVEETAHNPAIQPTACSGD